VPNAGSNRQIVGSDHRPVPCSAGCGSIDRVGRHIRQPAGIFRADAGRMQGCQADGIPELDYRIDLSVVGSLTAVQTDQVLWYLVLCSAPDIRIMCVTYQSNGMAIGDRVIVKGGYLRRDANHVLLDPCLANRPEQ
jgi:hypothetical protein